MDVNGFHVFKGAKLIGARGTEEEAKLFAEIHFLANDKMNHEMEKAKNERT